MGDSKNQIYENFKEKETDELIKILKDRSPEWSTDAFEAAEMVLKERNSEIPKPRISKEKLLFFVPCNSNKGKKPVRLKSYEGKLCLTDKRIMFFSCGTTGLLEALAEGVMGKAFKIEFVFDIIDSVEQLKKKQEEEIDTSALLNKGSWELEISENINCYPGGNNFSGHRITISGKNPDNSDGQYCVFAGKINKDTKFTIVNQIELVIEHARTQT